MVIILDKNKKQQQPPRRLLDHCRVIPVCSGKGGVGKSTVALYLALSLRAKGLRVGLLDADIYGPSIPTLLNLYDKPTALDEHTIAPIETNGLQVMSVGFFLKNEQDALIWRGPMVQKALMQLIVNTNWQNVDILLIDMPPGTGDIPLTLAQRVELQGAVVVATAQKLAVIEAQKAAKTFERLDVPILGVIENMASLFPENQLEAWVKERGYPLLGNIPFSASLAQACDHGALDETSTIRQAFTNTAENLLKL